MIYNKIFYSVFSVKFFSYIFSLVMGWVFNSQDLLIAMFIFVIADLLTGVWKAIKLKGFKSLTASGIRRTVEKLIGYSVIIILSNIIDEVIIKDIEWFSLIIITTGLIILAEFKSIAENLSAITENKIFINIYEYTKKLFSKRINNNETT